MRLLAHAVACCRGRVDTNPGQSLISDIRGLFVQRCEPLAGEDLKFPLLWRKFFLIMPRTVRLDGSDSPCSIAHLASCVSYVTFRRDFSLTLELWAAFFFATFPGSTFTVRDEPCGQFLDHMKVASHAPRVTVFFSMLHWPRHHDNEMAQSATWVGTS